MRFWGIVWTVWAVNLGLLMVFFLIFEGLALIGKATGDTLSEQVVVLREAGNPLYYIIIDVCVVAAITLAWCVWHFRYFIPRIN